MDQIVSILLGLSIFLVLLVVVMAVYQGGNSQQNISVSRRRGGSNNHRQPIVPTYTRWFPSLPSWNYPRRDNRNNRNDRNDRNDRNVPSGCRSNTDCNQSSQVCDTRTSRCVSRPRGDDMIAF